MPEDPKFNVIMPAYNEENALDQVKDFNSGLHSFRRERLASYLRFLLFFTPMRFFGLISDQISLSRLDSLERDLRK
jgi:hypothetical protein